MSANSAATTKNFIVRVRSEYQYVHP